MATAADDKYLVQLDEEEYRIVGPSGEEGPVVEYGDTAVLVVAGAVYYCHIEDGDMPEEDIKVLRVDNVTEMATAVEEVVFQDDGSVTVAAAGGGGGMPLVATEEEEEDEEDDDLLGDEDDDEDDDGGGEARRGRVKG